jgi:hypothetical protein
MITRIELENFKGAGARTQIDLAPLTLIFGANNAGKSTVLQSLLFVHEVLRRGSPDVDRTELGHDVVELGGFTRMVHKHDTDRSLKVRVYFTTRGTLNRFGRDLGRHPFPNLDDDITVAWVAMTARYRSDLRGAIIEAAEIGVGDEPIAWIELGAKVREGEPLLVRVNLGHPILGEWEEDAWGEVWDAWAPHAIDPGDTMDGPAPTFAIARSRLSALPAIEEPLRLITTGLTRKSPGRGGHSMSGSRSGTPAASRSSSWSDADDGGTLEFRSAEDIQTFLEMLVVGIPGQLADQLGRALYVGPLRAVPPRGSLYERTGRLSRWADGLAAWDALLGDRGQLVELTNTWLARLDARCKVVVQQLLDQGASAEDVAAEHVDASVRRLLLETVSGSLVLPSELGAGISQVVPVIVASFFAGKGGLVMIEQPEIHVHPALQVGLGDLIIEASRDRQMIIETHSEHIVLRLLRRIRETSERELPEGAPSFAPERLCVSYVETVDGAMQVRRLRVSDTGDFIDRWPHGFFEERVKEVF